MSYPPNTVHTWKSQEWPVNNASWAHGEWRAVWEQENGWYRIVTGTGVPVGHIFHTLVAHAIVSKNNEQLAKYEASHEVHLPAGAAQGGNE